MEAERPKPSVQPRYAQPSPELLAAIRLLILLAGQKTQNAYDGSGNLSATINQLGNVTASFGYDGSGNMTGRADGRIATQNEMQRLATGAVTTRALVYIYDGLNRLVRETCQATGGAASYDASYEYDLCGNRTKMVKDGETVSYVYNDAGQLITETSSISGAISYAYDAKGALIASSGRGESASYRYDLEDQLVGATIARRESGKAVAIEVTYVYDHSGFKVRSSSTVNIEGQSPITETRVFLPDADNFSGYTQVFEERLGSQLAASYVFSDELLAQNRSGQEREEVLRDGHGSTRNLVRSGSISSDYAFDAYGATPGGDPGVKNAPSSRHLYSGEQYDPMLKMQYLRARHYNQGNGSFNSVDPFSGNMQNPQSLNKYGYCHSDPVNGRDPTGKWSLTETLVVNATNGILRNMDKNIKVKKGAEAAFKCYVVAFRFSMILNVATLVFEEFDLIEKITQKFRSNAIPMILKYNKDMIRKFNLNVNKKTYSKVNFVTFMTGAFSKEVVSHLNNNNLARKINGLPNFFGSTHRVAAFHLKGKRKGIDGDTERAKRLSRRQRYTGTGPVAWHHHEVMGIMMQVDETSHRESHVGGASYWDACTDKWSYKNEP